MSIEILLNKQNPDGGWPYVRGVSWTEPTVYAVLALLGAGETERATRGLEWLLARQLPDGGWPPQACIDESTWVTALVALIPPERLGAAVHQRAIEWVLSTMGEPSTPTYRLRQWLLGVPKSLESGAPAWPWTPGAAAWVGPTVVAILALEQEELRSPSARIRERIAGGRRFLMQHMCREGGWNHGSSIALGYGADPYPETTGMALAALRGMQSADLDRSLAVAHRFLSQCRSADALNWLRLGLLAHGQLAPGYSPPPNVTFRTLNETSLGLLVAEAQRRSEVVFRS
jgi:prenyltransferase/squalene oxidase-like repeat protein